MGDNSEKINIFLSELTNAVGKLGIDEVTNILNRSTSDKVDISDKNIEFVVNLICSHYNIPFETVISEKNKSSKRMLVMAFCTYYLNRFFDYSLGDLNFLFKRSKSQLSRLKKKWIENELVKKKGSVYQTSLLFDIQVKSFLKTNK